MKIPAASIDGIDLVRIRRDFPEIATEILRLGELLSYGKESAGDVASLGRLLYSVGERRKAEELLRSNVVSDGDAAHSAYVELFDALAEQMIARSMMDFAKQFSISFSTDEKIGFLRFRRASSPQPNQAISDARIAPFLKAPAEIEFKYDSDGPLADVTSDLPELFAKYLILQYGPAGWYYCRGS